MRIFCCGLLIVLLASFHSDLQAPCEKAGLSSQADFTVGVAVNTQKLRSDARYRNLIISEFSAITPENSMKAKFIQPSRGHFDFYEVDYLMKFCRENNKRLHGHTLVWDKDNPRWMERFRGDKQAWEQLLKSHIQSVIHHCKDNIRSWDVLNEAFADDGTLKPNIWLKHIGEDYIEKCFQYASEADPSAVFFYNDYDLEFRPEKLEAVLSYFTALRKKGIRIDGIGMQMHIRVDEPYLSDINRAAFMIADSGFLVHYSELDISILGSGKVFPGSRHLTDLQQQRVKEIVAGYRKIDPAKRFGITMWGLSDNDSWLTEKSGNDRPLLFDTRYRPKPAYCGFLEGLKE